MKISDDHAHWLLVSMSSEPAMGPFNVHVVALMVAQHGADSTCDGQRWVLIALPIMLHPPVLQMLMEVGTLYDSGVA